MRTTVARMPTIPLAIASRPMRRIVVGILPSMSGVDATYVNGATGPLRARLLALSFLLLFVELALIRWTASNTLSLSSSSIFILLASFLGIGLVFWRAAARRDLFPFAAIGLTAL